VVLFGRGFSHGASIFPGLLLLLALMVTPWAGAAEDTDELRTRVEARWAALIAGDFDRAYEFQTPAYRKIYTAQQFRARFGEALRWKQARVVEIALKQPEVATVAVEVEYGFSVSGRGMMEDKVVDTETWLRVDGQWWHQLQQVVSPAESSKS
jgi:hypothetical protein